MKFRIHPVSFMIFAAIAVFVVGCGGQVGSIVGTVVDADGKPLSQAEVRLGDEAITTTSDGTFNFEEVPSGTHELIVLVNGETANVSNVQVAGESTTVTLTVAKAKVTGTVKDHEGNVVAGATVAIFDAKSTTSNSGTFSIDDVYYGTQTVAVYENDVLLHTDYIEVDAETTNVSIQLPSCLPGPNAPANMTMVFCQDFQGDETNPSAYGWNAAGGWKIVEANGQRWIESPGSGITSTYVDIDEIGPANKVVVEYDSVIMSGNDIYGANIMANEHPGGDLHRGGTGFLAMATGKGRTINMRRITDNNYPGISEGFDHHFHPTSFEVPEGSVVTLRVTYDHEGKLLNIEYNGKQAPDYPWELPTDALIQSAANKKLILYANGTVARWTNIRVWVD